MKAQFAKRNRLIAIGVILLVASSLVWRPILEARLTSLSDTELMKSGRKEARRELLRRAVIRQDGEAAAKVSFKLVQTPTANAADFLLAANACETTRHVNHAFWILNEGARRFPRDLRLLEARATFLRSQKNAAEELMALRAWLTEAPGAVEPNVRLGDLYFARGSVESASVYYQRALGKDRRLPIAMRRVALAAYFRGALKEAETEAQSALSLTPDEAVGHLLLGQILMGAGESRKVEAGASLEKALELDPNSVTAHYLLGLLSEEAREWTAARSRFERCLQLSPHYGAAAYHLARCSETERLLGPASTARLAHRRNEEQMLAARVLSMQLASNPSQVEVGLRLARLYRRMGRTRDALDAYRRVIVSGPGDPRVRREMSSLTSATPDR